MLKVTELSLAIAGRQLVSNVDFEVPSGGCLGIVGETGSGKSLTCRSLVGLLNPIGGAITRGSIDLDGHDLTDFTEREWRRWRGSRVAFIPQQSLSSLNPLMRIGEHLEETLRALAPDGDTRSRAADLLEQVQMPRVAEVLRAYPHELSGGMRQRVMIALAIAGRPSLLVADEPTTALDVTVQREILRLLTGLRADLGMTLVFVTHDLAVVSEVTTRLAIMYAGMTVESGPTAAILDAPDHPYTAALLNAHPSLTEGDTLTPIFGSPPPAGEWPTGCRFASRCPYHSARCDIALPSAVQVDPDRWSRCIHPAHDERDRP